MSRTRFAVSAVASIALLAVSGSASALTIDFEGLAHGALVSDQYEDVGVTITVDNATRRFDLGVAFDTGRTRTRDRDLEDPYLRGNIAAEDLGNALIIQQNSFRCSDDGICNVPDNEARRKAGSVTFSFSQPIQGFGFDLLDLDNLRIEGGKLEFFLDSDSVGVVSFKELFCTAGSHCDPTLVVGNRSANRILPIGFDGAPFDRVVLTLQGSAAIDNVTLTPTQVPEPSTGALFVGALAALLAVRRPRAL